MEEMITLPIQMPTTLYTRIKQAAEADDRSMAYIIRKATEFYLDTKGVPQTVQAQPAPREKKGAK